MHRRKLPLLIAVIALYSYAGGVPGLNVVMPCADEAVNGPQWLTPCCCLLEGSAETAPSVMAATVNDLSLRPCILPSCVRVLPATAAPELTPPTLASTHFGPSLYLLQGSLLI